MILAYLRWTVDHWYLYAPLAVGAVALAVGVGTRRAS